jgi:hypothetical protein
VYRPCTFVVGAALFSTCHVEDRDCRLGGCDLRKQTQAYRNGWRQKTTFVAVLNAQASSSSNATSNASSNATSNASSNAPK